MKNQKDGHQVNIEKEQQKIPHPKRIALTTVQSRDALGIEDYGEKSCIPVQHIKRVSQHFR
jgi:hypothetical protein